jgi:hypothetical protein
MEELVLSIDFSLRSVGSIIFNMNNEYKFVRRGESRNRNENVYWEWSSKWSDSNECHYLKKDRFQWSMSEVSLYWSNSVAPFLHFIRTKILFVPKSRMPPWFIFALHRILIDETFNWSSELMFDQSEMPHKLHETFKTSCFVIESIDPL